ncbi:DUF6641 family protein [Parvularcula sp. LCG005]|uniref:DUF6641 family protein n=1 Tax=Parvularcula sp. LCG005 TaxID=3078805 RepID=UPI002941BB75|nr:DUF6641 family protein [Parvularcula sp. LCG005]WOI53040.1 DUF6641 family protein [Parvularcula sp. LCG005]
MSVIEKLKIVAAEPASKMTAEERRRATLLTRLEEQLAAARHEVETGSPYQRLERVALADEETGEIKEVTRKKRFSSWWWIGADGNMFLALRYGGQPLSLKAGKSAIEVRDISEVVSVLEQLKQAALAGELDKLLAEAAKVRGVRGGAKSQKTSVKRDANT